MIAALYVETDGAYFGLGGVEPWDEAKDARRYTGPLPVVAHPPCQRWGRYWHGAPNKPNQYNLGEDGGCFAAALTAARNHGGVICAKAQQLGYRWRLRSRQDIGLRDAKLGQHRQRQIDTIARGILTDVTQDIGQLQRQPKMDRIVARARLRTAKQRNTQQTHRRCQRFHKSLQVIIFF